MSIQRFNHQIKLILILVLMLKSIKMIGLKLHLEVLLMNTTLNQSLVLMIHLCQKELKLMHLLKIHKFNWKEAKI